MISSVLASLAPQDCDTASPEDTHMAGEESTVTPPARPAKTRRITMDGEVFDELMQADKVWRDGTTAMLARVVDKLEQAPSRTEWRLMGAAIAVLGMAMLTLLFFFAYAFVAAKGGDAAGAMEAAKGVMGVVHP